MSAPLFRLDATRRVIPAQQTRVSSFVLSAHGAHVQRLAAALPGLMRDSTQVALHGEYCRELELISLLTRATVWTLDLQVPWLALQWQAAWWPKVAGTGEGAVADLTVDMLAFGHALHSTVRPALLLPPDADPRDAFASALQTFEFESGRLIQLQAGFLKHAAAGERRDQVETIVASRRQQVAALWTSVIDGLPQTG